MECALWMPTTFTNTHTTNQKHSDKICMKLVMKLILSGSSYVGKKIMHEKNYFIAYTEPTIIFTIFSFASEKFFLSHSLNFMQGTGGLSV